MIVKNGAPPPPSPITLRALSYNLHVWIHIPVYVGYIIFKGKYITQFKCPIPS